MCSGQRKPLVRKVKKEVSRLGLVFVKPVVTQMLVQFGPEELLNGAVRVAPRLDAVLEALELESQRRGQIGLDARLEPHHDERVQPAPRRQTRRQLHVPAAETNNVTNRSVHIHTTRHTGRKQKSELFENFAESGEFCHATRTSRFRYKSANGYEKHSLFVPRGIEVVAAEDQNDFFAPQHAVANFSILLSSKWDVEFIVAEFELALTLLFYHLIVTLVHLWQQVLKQNGLSSEGTAQHTFSHPVVRSQKKLGTTHRR